MFCVIERIIIRLLCGLPVIKIVPHYESKGGYFVASRKNMFHSTYRL